MIRVVKIITFWKEMVTPHNRFTSDNRISTTICGWVRNCQLPTFQIAYRLNKLRTSQTFWVHLSSTPCTAHNHNAPPEALFHHDHIAPLLLSAIALIQYADIHHCAPLAPFSIALIPQTPNINARLLANTGLIFNMQYWIDWICVTCDFASLKYRTTIALNKEVIKYIIYSQYPLYHHQG